MVANDDVVSVLVGYARFDTKTRKALLYDKYIAALTMYMRQLSPHSKMKGVFMCGCYYTLCGVLLSSSDGDKCRKPIMVCESSFRCFLMLVFMHFLVLKVVGWPNMDPSLMDLLANWETIVCMQMFVRR